MRYFKLKGRRCTVRGLDSIFGLLIASKLRLSKQQQGFGESL
jgi:hypothetical protein